MCSCDQPAAQVHLCTTASNWTARVAMLLVAQQLHILVYKPPPNATNTIKEAAKKMLQRELLLAKLKPLDPMTSTSSILTNVAYSAGLYGVDVSLILSPVDVVRGAEAEGSSFSTKLSRQLLLD